VSFIALLTITGRALSTAAAAAAAARICPSIHTVWSTAATATRPTLLPSPNRF